MPEPPGTAQVSSIVEEILKAYPASLTLPQITDLLLTEVFLKDTRTKGWLRRIFPLPDLSMRVELARSYINSLISAGACPVEVGAAIKASTPDHNGSRVAEGPVTSTPPTDKTTADPDKTPISDTNLKQ